MNARIETTGKQEVRSNVQGRILEMTTRLATIRQIAIRRLGATHDVIRTIDQAELQLTAQRRIADRVRSTMPALRAAAVEAERVCQVTAAEVGEAVDTAKRVELSESPTLRDVLVRENSPFAKAGEIGEIVVPTKRRRPVVERAEVVHGAGERVQVLMVTYPVYRYDVTVDGAVVWSIPATRAWKREKKQAIDTAVATV